MVGRSFKNLVLCSVLVLMLTSVAVAGRPLETATTDTAAEGALELELGTLYESGNVVSKSFTCEATLCYGVLDNLEASFSTGGIVHGDVAGNDITGMADSSLAAKWRFVGGDESATAAAVELSVNLPTGDVSKGLGSDEYDVTVVLAGSVELPADCILTVNGGYNFLMTEDDTATGAIALEKTVTDELTLVAEAVLDQSVYGNKEDRSGRGLVGATYALSEDTVIDFGVGAGFDNRTPDISAVLGVTHAF